MMVLWTGSDLAMTVAFWLAVSAAVLFLVLVVVTGILGAFTNFGFDSDWEEVNAYDESEPSWDDPHVDELMLACAAEGHRTGCCHPDCLNGPEDPHWRRKRFFGRDS